MTFVRPLTFISKTASIDDRLRRSRAAESQVSFFCFFFFARHLSGCQFQRHTLTRISPLRRDGSRCCHGSTEEPPKSASCSGWMGRETKQTRRGSFRAATNCQCVAMPVFLVVVFFFFSSPNQDATCVYVLALPPPCVLPGHRFAVHKASVGSFHDFETQVSSVHADEMGGKRK